MHFRYKGKQSGPPGLNQRHSHGLIALSRLEVKLAEHTTVFLTMLSRMPPKAAKFQRQQSNLIQKLKGSISERYNANFVTISNILFFLIFIPKNKLRVRLNF